MGTDILINVGIVVALSLLGWSVIFAVAVWVFL